MFLLDWLTTATLAAGLLSVEGERPLRALSIREGAVINASMVEGIRGNALFARRNRSLPTPRFYSSRPWCFDGCTGRRPPFQTQQITDWNKRIIKQLYHLLVFDSNHYGARLYWNILKFIETFLLLNVTDIALIMSYTHTRWAARASLFIELFVSVVDNLPTCWTLSRYFERVMSHVT